MTTVRVIPLDPDHARVLNIALIGERRSDPAVDAAWDAMRRESPALFDGPIVLVDPPTVSLPTLRGELATYRHAATAGATGRRVRSLGVKGLLLARDRAGAPHTLVGLRSSSTRIYPGLWELAPAGSVEPPGRGAATITLAAMIETLRVESNEELGLDLPASACTPIALIDDDQASSVDILFRCDLAANIERLPPPCAGHEIPSSEYAAVQWVPVGELPGWLRRSADAIAPPTAQIVRWLADAFA